MKLRKAIVCLSMCLAIGSSAAAPMASEAKSLEPKSEAKVSVKNQKNSKSGWVKRGKNRYYRMKNGKLEIVFRDLVEEGQNYEHCH